MAGSGSRPLTNIPYCCLPQESGPCLSASVGDRPLRSPTHRRLGGPSPRLPSNGTHARPVPPEGFDAPGMPLARRMADYPAFPPATRRDGVGCIRVTHPSATLTVPKGCTIVALVFYSESRVPPRCSLCVPCHKVPCPARLTPRRYCAGLRLSKNSAPEIPSANHSSLPKAGAKVQPFPRSTMGFSKNISSQTITHCITIGKNFNMA